MPAVYTVSPCFNTCRNITAATVYAFYPPPLTIFNHRAASDCPTPLSGTISTFADGRIMHFSRTKTIADGRTIFCARANAAIETGKTRAARAALQEAFALMARTINALMLLEGEEPYRILADNINTEVRQALATRRGGGKTTEEPQTPETPEE